MSGYDDHDLLTTTLRDRAGDMDGHTLGLDDVKGRARGIRRRRRAVGGIAVAAVVLASACRWGRHATGLDRGQQPPVASQDPVAHVADDAGPGRPQRPGRRSTRRRPRAARTPRSCTPTARPSTGPGSPTSSCRSSTPTCCRTPTA